MSESTDLVVECEAGDIRGLLSPEAELALYRIVQDALSSVVRHASATRVRIQIAPSPRGGVVVVDGVGFRLEDVLARNACIGLLGMEERALYVAGTVDVDTTPGEGTRLRVQFPAGSS